MFGNIFSDIKSIIILGMSVLSLLLGAGLWFQQYRVESRDETIKQQKQTIANKEEEIRVIGINVNNTLAQRDANEKNDIIDANTSIRTGHRRMR